MDFDEGDRPPRQGSAQSDAGMGKPGGIDNDESDLLFLGQLHPVDERSLLVALEADHHHARGLALSDQAAINIRQSFATVDLRLARTPRDQNGAVEDQYSLRLTLSPACGFTRSRAGGRFQHICEFAANR